MATRDELIERAESVIRDSIDDATVPPSVAIWQAANALVDAGWRPGKGVEITSTDAMDSAQVATHTS